MVAPGGGLGGGGAPIVNPLCSNAELVVRQLPASKDMNMEAEEATVLEAIIRQPTNTQQTEKT
jgi:hypothetical protein